MAPIEMSEFTCNVRPCDPSDAPAWQLCFLLDTGSQGSVLPADALPPDLPRWPLRQPRVLRSVLHLDDIQVTHFTRLRVYPYAVSTPVEISFFIADVDRPLLNLKDMVTLGFELSAPPLSPFEGVPPHEFDSGPTVEPIAFAKDRKRLEKALAPLLKVNAAIRGPCTHELAVWNARLKDPSRFHVGTQYPIAKEVFEQLQKEVLQMQEDGVIEEVSHPESQCLTFVPVLKSKGATVEENVYRFCINPSVFNDNIQEPYYAMNQSINDLLHRIIKGRFITHLDLKSAFHSCPVAEESRKYLVFRFGSRFFRFLRTPFGLADLPAHFSQLINAIMTGLEGVVFYIDDIVVVSDTMEEHIERVSEVIRRLNEYNLRLNEEKCAFAVTEAKVLGFLVSHNRLRADPDKVGTISAIERPTNMKELRGFVSQIGYLRQVIPNYGVHLHSLLELLRKSNNDGQTLTRNTAVKWTEEAERAFVALKEGLAKAISLAVMPDKVPPVLFCDASHTAYGAALGYWNTGGEFVIVDVFHAQYKGYEKNYMSVKKECLAMVRAVVHFHGYLFGRKFTICTDCQSLAFMGGGHTADRTMRGWLAEMGSYQYHIKHVAGTLSNWLCDGISRLETSPCAPRLETQSTAPEQQHRALQVAATQVGVTGSLAITTTGSSQSPRSLATSPSREGVVEQTLSPSSEAAASSLPPAAPSDGTAEANAIPTSDASALDVHKRTDVLRRAHALTGHASRNIMVAWVKREGMSWTNMHREADQVVANCIQCLGWNVHKRGFAEAKSKDATQPWEHLQMDLHGTMDTVSSTGNRYIFLLVDIFTGFVYAAAIPNKEAVTVAFALLQACMLLGVPKIVSSDNGTEFVNKVITNVKELLGFNHEVSAAYNPRAQGRVERKGGALAAVLHKLRHETGKEWDRLLPTASFIMNTRVDSVTGFAPFELMYNRAPADLQPYLDATPKYDAVGWHAHLRQAHELISASTREKREKAAKKQNTRLNASRRVVDPWKPGQTVMIRYQGRDKGQPRWVGPYSVVSYSGSRYTLQDAQGKQLNRTVPQDQTKPVGDELGVDLYAVDRVIDKRKRNGVTQYRIRWAGFDPAEDTWEPLENIMVRTYVEEFEAARARYKSSTDPVARLRRKQEGERDATSTTSE